MVSIRSSDAERLAVKLCCPEDAAVVYELTQAAYAPYADFLEPPSGVTRESKESVRGDLEADGGAIASLGKLPVGCLRFKIEEEHLHVRRVAVLPEFQGKGVGTRLMLWVHDHARSLGLDEVRLGVRRQLPRNQAFYKRLGYKIVGRHLHPGQRRVFWYEMSLSL